MSDLSSFVDSMFISREVLELRPDCVVLVIAIDGVVNGPSDDVSRSWLREACETAAANGHEAHQDAWRAAYRTVGVKPQRFRPSFDALIRRSASGLPPVNRAVDAYNAISVRYGLPVGGENVEACQGSPRLVRADGTELFDTVFDGTPTTELVDAGEVVWLDDLGVTCRRWNWRQGVRTRIHHDTRRVYFLLECLSPFPVERLHLAGEELIARVTSSESSVATRLIEFRVGAR